MTLSGSTLYGTTRNGGAVWLNNDLGWGTVFSIATSGGSPTMLYSFTGDGAYPAPGLTLSGSTLYGAAALGGANGYGEVFSIAASGGSPTTLCSFNDGTGSQPSAVSLNGAMLYGTTFEGGNLSLNNGYGLGTVFSVATTGGSPTTLCSFSGSNGASPLAGVTLDGSTLYRTTSDGGANNYGTVFSIATSGCSVTTLCSFSGNNGEILGWWFDAQ